MLEVVVEVGVDVDVDVGGVLFCVVTGMFGSELAVGCFGTPDFDGELCRTESAIPITIKITATDAAAINERELRRRRCFAFESPMCVREECFGTTLD